MKKNMGSTDKIIRLIVAIILATLSYMGVVTGTVAIVFYTVAIVFALTSMIRFCPLYIPFGISTCKKK
ncbi:YgaP family membrane protein [Flavobacterium sp. SUN046]|uniref:YgaP family membrane protein n=1 Tax=Flavobacterium sp. SUN046 TaxID=3002440 RepID=UPI002DBDF145|nr:DUF2892 domain-containing protein [Flavobacterium sp. SUN046]